MKENVKRSIYTTEAVVSQAIAHAYTGGRDDGSALRMSFELDAFARRVLRGKAIMALAGIAWDRDAATSCAVCALLKREGGGAYEAPLTDDVVLQVFDALSSEM